MLLLTAKNLAIVFALATTAFCVSTVVLAVQNSDLEDELQDALDKLDAMGTTVMTTSSTTASTNTPDPSAPTSNTSEGPTPTDSSTTTTASAGTPSSSESSPASSITPTTITPSTATPSTAATSTVTPVDQHPDYPTLPTGLPNVDEIVYRLPNHIRPVRYRLYWHPDIEQKTCEGTVSVQIEVDEVTNLIVMHAKDLVIENISILQMMVRMRLKIKEFYLSPERELLIIELDELIYTATPYVVSISFSCTMSGLSGLYTSSYSDEDNEQR